MSLPIVEAAELDLHLGAVIKYSTCPAEPDVGVPAHVEIISLKINGVEVPLTEKQNEWLEDQLKETA